MAICSTVASSAPSHSAPNSEYSTTYRNAGPKSNGPAPDSSAIIHPPITNSTRPTASATRYGTSGQNSLGRPYRHVSGSLPHITEPIATPTPARNGRVVVPRGAADSTSPGMSVNPLTTRYSTHTIISGATRYRAKAVMPVNPNRLLTTPTRAKITLISTTFPHPNSPSYRFASRLNANAVQPAAIKISSAETTTEPTTPNTDRVSSACVCPVREPRYAAGNAYAR